MTDEIRKAMDARLAALEPSPERRARIRAEIAHMNQEEEPQMKRKLSTAMVVAIALMIALSGIAVAEIAGLNLFAFFAQNTQQETEYWDIDQRILTDLQEKSTLISASIAPTEVEMLDGYIQLHDAYYDGDVLFLGTVTREWETSRAAVEWTPTEEELAEHAPEKWPIAEREASPYQQEQPFIDAFNEAQVNHQPYGYKTYHYIETFISYRTAGGTTVMPIGDRRTMTEDGTAYSVLQMQSPLPEEIRQKETIEIELIVPINVEYHWFDGEKHYYWSEDVDTVVSTATIARSQDARQLRYQSEPAVIDGVTVTAEAVVSPYLAHVTLRAEEPVFLPETDEQGEPVDPWSVRVVDGGTGGELSTLFAGLTQRRSYGPEEKFVFYQKYSEDGMTCERYLSLVGAMPDSLTVTVSRENTEQATFALTPNQ